MTLLPAIPLVSMALFHVPLKYLWRSTQDLLPVPLSIYGAPPSTP